MNHVTYRLWDSSETFVDVDVEGWLEDAIRKTGMAAPWRAQFFTGDRWLNVLPHAVTAAIKSAQGKVAA